MIRTLVLAGWGSDVTAPGNIPAAIAADIDTLVETLWQDQPTRNLWRSVAPEARALLEELHAAGVPMAVVSNSEGRARETLTEVGVASYFRAVVDSGAVGIAKPDPRIFRLAADELGLPLEQLVHIGDSESADVVGALAAGAYAIRFDGLVPNAGTPTQANARVDGYDELRTVLRRALGLPD
jgi:HAD superfamily hydrolase (TIGR01509 family)